MQVCTVQLQDGLPANPQMHAAASQLNFLLQSAANRQLLSAWLHNHQLLGPKNAALYIIVFTHDMKRMYL